MSTEPDAVLTMMYSALVAGMALIFFAPAYVSHPLLGYAMLIVFGLAAILLIGSYTYKAWAIKTGGFLLRKARIL